jgi:hypothetical protein
MDRKNDVEIYPSSSMIQQNRWNLPGSNFTTFSVTELCPLISRKIPVLWTHFFFFFLKPNWKYDINIIRLVWMYNKFFYDLLWCNIFQTFTTIELTITPIEDYMNNINTVTPYLQVVSALIQADFTCSVVSLKKTGRFLHHSSCL